jgi:excisionase family DNA binding protein
MPERPMEIARTITIEKAAERFDGVSPWTLRTWVREGILSHCKVGKRVLLIESELADLLARTYRPARRPVDGNGTPPIKKLARRRTKARR